MTIRDLRFADTPRVLDFLLQHFPEEERILGTRPEGFAEVVRRVFRWDARFVLGLLRLVGRPVFRFFVVEADGRLVATTLLTFSARTGYVSMVAVDPAYRRRGLARRLLEESRSVARRRGERYIALDVLAENAPARALYDSLGYRPLRSATYLVLDLPTPLARTAAPPTGLRPFRREDAEPLSRIARRQTSPEVEEVLPTTSGSIAGSEWVGRLLATDAAAWVVDRGLGPVAWVSATVTRATEAAHVSAPIVDPTVDPGTARALVESAIAWLAARHPPRLTAMVTEENGRGRAALEAAGFRDALPLWTLYRPTA